MPCELGMTITWQQLNPVRQTWFVFEAQNRRIQKSLSDLDGTDANIHGGTMEGVMRELCNAFVRRGPQPGVPQMLRPYRRVRPQVGDVMRVAGAHSVFDAYLRIYALLLAQSLKKWKTETSGRLKISPVNRPINVN